MLAAERYDGAEPVNLGTGKEISIRELAELVAERHRVRGRDRRGTRRSRTASRGAALDATRARELFGFEARTPLRDGLERTVAWYREHALTSRVAPAPPATPTASLVGISNRRDDPGIGLPARAAPDPGRESRTQA